MTPLNVRKIAAAVDVWAALHRDELIRDISELIAIRSVSEPGEGGHAFGTGCRQALDKLLSLAQAYGFDTEDDAGFCASVIWRGTEGGQELGLLGHLDTVPQGDGWKTDPFRAVCQNGWLIGRGAADNKGPAVTALYVLRCMRELGLTLRSDLRLIAGCDEERGMQDVRHYLQTHTPPKYTLNCDGAWAACIAEKGILTADLTVPLAGGSLTAMDGGSASNTVPDTARALFADGREPLCVQGKTAHCYLPHLGDNAIVKLWKRLIAEELLSPEDAKSVKLLLECFADDCGTGLRIFHSDSLSGKTTCVPSLMRLENGVLTVHINVRYAVTQRSQSLLAAMKKRLSKLGIGIAHIQDSPPRHDPADGPVVSMLLDTCEDLLGKSHKPYVMGGGTHSRVFPRSIPYGPLVLDPRRKNPFGEPHGPNEAVCVDDLVQAMKVYVIALMRLDTVL